MTAQCLRSCPQGQTGRGSGAKTTWERAENDQRRHFSTPTLALSLHLSGEIDRRKNGEPSKCRLHWPTRYFVERLEGLMRRGISKLARHRRSRPAEAAGGLALTSPGPPSWSMVTRPPDRHEQDRDESMVRPRQIEVTRTETIDPATRRPYRPRLLGRHRRSR